MRSIPRLLCVFVIVPCVFCCFVRRVPAQTTPENASLGKRQPSIKSKSPTVYEDEGIKVTVPADWAVLHPQEKSELGKSQYGSLGNSVLPGKGRLVVKKLAYVLAMAYDTSHASGIKGADSRKCLTFPGRGWRMKQLVRDTSKLLRSLPAECLCLTT